MPSFVLTYVLREDYIHISAMCFTIIKKAKSISAYRDITTIYAFFEIQTDIDNSGHLDFYHNL